MEGGQFGDFEIVPNVIPGDDDDIEDETIVERLWALTEMFPQPIRNVTSTVVDGSYRITTGTFRLARSALWFASTTATVLMLPYLFERERLELEQMQQMEQQRMLLGPHAAMAGIGGQPRGGMPGSVAGFGAAGAG